ncbi:MAG: RdgB/HAM1 family non-canonical purine NTP pyrophosphatase [Parachlamydiaceae bacterium]|nr:RdgB/HAM1 family non-canonical purine NTP pyrophosphatase [Parachlamydiaceae bacterium]
MEIVIASNNLHKIREFRGLLKGFKSIDLLSLVNFPSYLAPPEDGKTFQDNAIRKAEHAAKELNKWVLADDSGLVVPALNGSPGVNSRRYAGEEATDSENRYKLLEAMLQLKSSQRSAYFECCLALASPNGLKKCVTGLVEGVILLEEKGRNGFGYDSLFVKYEYDKSFAELEEATKNRISHRHKAFEKLTPTLESLES